MILFLLLSIVRTKSSIVFDGNNSISLKTVLWKEGARLEKTTPTLTKLLPASLDFSQLGVCSSLTNNSTFNNTAIFLRAYVGWFTKFSLF